MPMHYGRLIMRAFPSVAPALNFTGTKVNHRLFSSVSSEAPSRGAGFFQRVGSFISGAGLTALATQYFIYQEIVDGNRVMLLKQKDIENRVSSLEKKL
mmetsp:Transcript_24373/g.24791  ORF Transcript_24373/g.24791 Transcript_24373/m.24791 type:complete len:98 (-) Transcript_24373:202-495(-)|eukprot:CAMPEP_0171296958 /NCGR_PEP_ID=MMETSP0816-20121228/5691_1 /TAXON_ID=420281 /ORGANISM="Proboscia inermis, Strain CCAP1064/1" /LENGTH=97 /DNA_ID=CAMNT_0011770849 /DNA_START=16 /DNA_END=309 /DNA_ORIENTATION=+